MATRVVLLLSSTMQRGGRKQGTCGKALRSFARSLSVRTMRSVCKPPDLSSPVRKQEKKKEAKPFLFFGCRVFLYIDVYIHTYSVCVETDLGQIEYILHTASSSITTCSSI